MSKRLLILAAIGVCIVLAGFTGWAIGHNAPAGQARKQSEPILGQAPVYKGVTNQLGQTVNSAQFKGKVRVVTFLFPYCTTYCPLIAAHLVGLENLLKDSHLQNRVEIVAFDVDPVGTGPKQMRAFLQEYGWDPKNLHWQYLTGGAKQIRHIVTDGYHVAYAKTTDDGSHQPVGPPQTPQPTVVNKLAQKANVDYDIAHNDGLEIVDGQGRIRKIYAQADTLSNSELLEAIRPLLHAKSGS